MAYAVVDEAIRNVVAVGADPDRVALLDNFSWGDPRRPSTLGELVAAVDGCCAAARMYNAPFVSGKDSLNNEYVGADGQRHAVPPTLVITAVAHVPDADHCVTPDLAEPGNVAGPHRRDRDRVRRLASRPCQRPAPRTCRRCARPRSGRTRALPAPARGDAGRAGRGLPRRQRGRPRRRAGRDVHRRPPRATRSTRSPTTI